MKNFFLTLMVLALAACGFEPLYGRNVNEPVGVENRLALVDIGNIANREGQYLRNALIDRFYRSGRPGDPLYKLDVSDVRETLIDLDITKSADATRGQLRLDTKIVLSDARNGQVLLQRDISAITSYNILGSEFATRVSEDNTRLNALDDLARQIELQLNLYFKKD